MLSSLSSNVILSKARAMYGRRLTPQNYSELLNCQTVSEVAGYLKNRTAYGKILSGINETDIHRGQLENRLRQKIFQEYDSLCRYELSVGEHFAGYLIALNEIEQIMHSLMLLMAGTPQEYIFNMPMFLNRHTNIDLPSLSKIKNYDDLLLALGRTPYHDLLEPFRPTAGIPIDFTGIETALYTYLYRKVFEVIDDYTGGQTAKQLYDLFNTYIDLQNYVRIFRLKKYYHVGSDYVRANLLPFGNISVKRKEELIAAETPEEITKIMSSIAAEKKFMSVEHSFVDELPGYVLFEKSRHYIRFSTHPSVVMIAYMFLMETELKDIINIIEGIRYKLPTDEIAKLLTIIKYEGKE